MSELSADAKRRIDKLKKAYVGGFPEKTFQLQALWKNLESKEFSEHSLIELAAFCHKLAGSSGSYEFMEISQAANSVEEYCHSGFSSIGQNKAYIIELNARYLNLVKLLDMR